MDDPVAVSMRDQQQAATKELRRSTHDYCAGLVEAGFSKREALSLTGEWLKGLAAKPPAE